MSRVGLVLCILTRSQVTSVCCTYGVASGFVCRRGLAISGCVCGSAGLHLAGGTCSEAERRPRPLRGHRGLAGREDTSLQLSWPSAGSLLNCSAPVFCGSCNGFGDPRGSPGLILHKRQKAHIIVHNMSVFLMTTCEIY